MRGALRGLPTYSFKNIREQLYRESFTLYHPASILYNRSLRPDYEADVRRLGAALRDEA